MRKAPSAAWVILGRSAAAWDAQSCMTTTGTARAASFLRRRSSELTIASVSPSAFRLRSHRRRRGGHACSSSEPRFEKSPAGLADPTQHRQLIRRASLGTPSFGHEQGSRRAQHEYGFGSESRLGDRSPRLDQALVGSLQTSAGCRHARCTQPSTRVLFAVRADLRHYDRQAGDVSDATVLALCANPRRVSSEGPCVQRVLRSVRMPSIQVRTELADWRAQSSHVATRSASPIGDFASEGKRLERTCRLGS